MHLIRVSVSLATYSVVLCVLLADRTNGRDYATVLRLSSVRL